MKNPREVLLDNIKKWREKIKKIEVPSSVKFSVLVGLLLATGNYLINLILHPIAVFILTFLAVCIFLLLMSLIGSILMSYISSVTKQNQKYRRTRENLHNQILELRKENFKLRLVASENKDIIERTLPYLYENKKEYKLLRN